MKVQIRLFATMREVFGESRLEREMPAGATVADLVSLLREDAQSEQPIGNLHVAVNHKYVGVETQLHEGDEVAIFPPVSGGSTVRRFEITSQPLSLDVLAERVTAPDRGAIVLFSGTVRGVTADMATDYLEYEAYAEMAEASLAQIGDEMRERWPQVLDVAIVHRIGRLEIGESSVMIAVAAAHRQGVFDACSYAIERLKQIAPIWKKEVGPDGNFWVEGPRAEGSPPTV